MSKCDIKISEGPEKYCFISYAHKDSETVYKIMEGLDRRGYRMWYDEGIDPGIEWPEEIASHLKESAVCVTFISENYIASQNCKRELTYALSQNKPLLVIFIEEVNMSAGLEMQLSAQQCTFSYKYNDLNEFLNKATSGDLLVECRKEGFYDEEISEEKPEYLNSNEDILNLSDTQKNEKRNTKNTDKKKLIRLLLFGALGGVALVIISLAVVLYALLAPVKICGRNYNRDSFSVSISDTELKRSDIRKIKKLRNVSSVEIRDCNVTGDALSLLTLNDSIRDLSFVNVQGQSKYDFLEDMQLTSLTLDNCGLNDENFPGYSADNLYALDVSNNPDLTKIDMSLFENSSGSIKVYISHTGINSIDELLNIEGIYGIEAEGCNITAVNGASDSLAVLSLSDNLLTDFSFIQNMPSLEKIDLSDNQIKNVPQIQEFKTLTFLDVSNNQLSSVDALVMFPYLMKLNVSGNIDIKDLSAIKFFADLEIFYAENCSIEKFPYWESLNKSLKVVSLSGNKINDLSEFAGKNIDNPELQLFLASNKITDCSSLAGTHLKLLELCDNPILYSKYPQNLVCDYELILPYSRDMIDYVSHDDSVRMIVIDANEKGEKDIYEKYGYEVTCVSFNDYSENLYSSHKTFESFFQYDFYLNY